MNDTEHKNCKSESCGTVMDSIKCHMLMCKKCAMLWLGVGGVMLLLALIMPGTIIKLLWILLSLGFLGLGAMTFFKK